MTKTQLLQKLRQIQKCPTAFQEEVEPACNVARSHSMRRPVTLVRPSEAVIGPQLSQSRRADLENEEKLVDEEDGEEENSNKQSKKSTKTTKMFRNFSSLFKYR